MADSWESGEELLEQLIRATNEHHLEALVDCFSAEYRNETPAHPARGFVGASQVRRNWEQIFSMVPDIRARVLRRHCDNDVVWSEWEMTGTRRDGSAHKMVGVILFGMAEGRFAWARFYLEPFESGDMDVDAALRQHVGADDSGPSAELAPPP